MENRIKVLVVDDDQSMRKRIGEHIDTQDDMEVAGYACDGMEALEMVRRVSPDVITLDMIMPNLDGFGVVKELSEMLGEKQPVIICTSAIARVDLVQRAMEKGVRYYMIKPFRVDVLVERIRELVDINPVLPSMSVSATGGLRITDRKNRLKVAITDIFLMIGIPAHIRGFHYLREAIGISVKQNGVPNRITKDLYPAIAEKFETTPSKVERAIRHAIEVAWNRGRIQKLNDLFGFTVYGKHDKPTNGEFIALVADKLIMDRVS